MSMTVLYRLCPEGNPLKQRPIRPKLNLISACFHSFIKAFETVCPKVWFLVDKPSDELMEIVEGCPFPFKVETFRFGDWGSGNKGTFYRQLDIASGLEGKVFFLEDDYYFLPEAGKAIDEALDSLAFLTPYDHPGYYTEEGHRYKREVRIAGNRHWQTVKDTTLTFATHANLVKHEIETMKFFGWVDVKLWAELSKRHQLWSPIPSLATHMETPYLSPVIDWQSRW